MKRSILALTVLAALPFAAVAADGVSYNYVQGGYTATKTDFGDAKGFGVDGSVAFHPNFHVFAGHDKQEIDGTNGIDFEQSRLGVGYNLALSPKADLVTRVAYEKFDAGQGLTLDGASAEVGVRGALTPMLEGYVTAGYEDFEQADSEVYGKIGAQVKFNQNWGVAGDVKFIDGDKQFFVGPRFTW